MFNSIDFIDACVLIVVFTIGLWFSSMTDNMVNIYLNGMIACAIISNLLIYKHAYEILNDIAE